MVGPTGTRRRRELSGEILSTVGVGLALAVFIWRIIANMEARLGKRIERSEDQMIDVRERVARMEGLFGHVFRKEKE